MPVISTNTSANTALRYLNSNSAEQSSITAKIASGSRIQKASDDAAGLAIGTKIESDVTTLMQAATNASNGASILQAADGGLSNISDILQRMKQLSTQALSGAVTDDERAFIDAEFQELIEEIDGIATGTRFNGQSLLDGSTDFVTGTGVDFMVGSDVTDIITVEISDVDATALGVNALDVTDTANATAASTAIDTAIATVSQTRAEVGAQISRFEFRGDSIATQTENLDAAKSSIMDADIAYEQAQLSSAEVLTEASIAALSKANETPQSLLQLIR